MRFRQLRNLLSGWHRRGRLEALHEAVEHHLDVLPVAGAQLRDASHQVETAVTQVGANFERMVLHARESATQAARLLGSGEGRALGVDELLAQSRHTLEELLARIVGDSGICQGLARRMAELESDMRRIVSALADVDRISFGNTILALNAKIEAAHMGDRGQGFEIVAQELWQQSRRSEEITEGIRGMVGQLSRSAGAAAAEVGALVCADLNGVEALRLRVQQALDQLETTHQETQQMLAGAGERNEALAAEIAGAVQTLQFQDRVSQRIGHIVEALESMHRALREPLEGDGIASPATGRTQAAAPLLSESYTMERERSIHAEAVGRPVETADAGPDVELF